MSEPKEEWENVAEVVDDWTTPRFTSAELAAILGMSYDTYKRRLRGTQPWRPGELQILANLFHMSVDDLTGSTTAPPDTS